MYILLRLEVPECINHSRGVRFVHPWDFQKFKYLKNKIYSKKNNLAQGHGPTLPHRLIMSKEGTCLRNLSEEPGKRMNALSTVDAVTTLT